MEIRTEEPYDYLEKKPLKGAAFKHTRRVKEQRNAQEGLNLRRIALDKFRTRTNSKDCQEVIDLLTEHLEKNPDDTFSEKMLAFCLIDLKMYGDAYKAFKRIHEREPNDVEALNALAFLNLLDGPLEDSINYLLDAVYLDKDNNKLKNNLESLRNIKDKKVFFSMTDPKDFLFIKYPKENISESIINWLKNALLSPILKLLIAIIILSVVILMIYIFYPQIINMAEEYRFKRGLGTGRVTHVTIQDINKFIEERKKYNIKLSEDDIKKKFETIKVYIEEKKRNRAAILINELLNSNASELVKERVRFLKEFLPKPEPTLIDFTPSVQEVTRIPFLYEGVYVRWTGTIANLEHKDRKETVFDLLINFVDNAVVEGIAECHFDGFQNIINGEKLSVYGEIAGITLDNKIILMGKEIQRLGK